MLVGSFFSGIVPMAFKLSDSKSRLLALMGSGILVGTALAIIIPEGIDSLYSQPTLISDNIKTSYTNENPPLPELPIQTWTIGMSLVAGFVLMLLIDQFSIYQSGGDHHSPKPQQAYHLTNQEDVDDSENNEVTEINFETTSETRPIRNNESHRVSLLDLDSSERGISHQQHIMPDSQNRGRQTKVTPTLGLVIHAAADGIALGAAATTSHRDVEMIIFLAIMLHKAPAAFSLVVFLLHRGLKHSTIRRHLLAFSLSAPLAALVTYFGLSQSGKEALRRNNATGIAMLFSAGTFLYVATVHVLPELVHNTLLTPKELLFLVGGSFLPLILTQAV